MRLEFHNGPPRLVVRLDQAAPLPDDSDGEGEADDGKEPVHDYPRMLAQLILDHIVRQVFKRF